MALYLTEAELTALDEKKEFNVDDKISRSTSLAKDAMRYSANAIPKTARKVASGEITDAKELYKAGKEELKDNNYNKKRKERASKSPTYHKYYKQITGLRGFANAISSNTDKVGAAFRMDDTIDRHNRRHPDRKVLESGIFESVEII